MDAAALLILPADRVHCTWRAKKLYMTDALQFPAIASVMPQIPHAAAAQEGTGFASAISEVGGADRAESYVAHLRNKYGAHFRIESIPRDPEALERVGRTMSGDDVIISPIALDRMIDDPSYGARIERTIDHCFETVPRDKAHFAAIGLTFEPCGVVVHDDGTVTYICGGGDTPEKVAKINAINAARDAHRAAQRRMYIEKSAEHALELREMFAERAAAQSAQLGRIARTRTDTQFSAGVSSAALTATSAGQTDML